MPEFSLSMGEIARTKKKQGVYSSLKKVPETKERMTVTNAVKAAFIEYARLHKCPPNKEKMIWEGFEKILRKYL